ncbi:ABC transporter ATP-binding protein [Filibacter tadaridae]|uniref:Daunorubicin/doxorubicin resistance ATP-binding protein DrrA n=1 Tax=Filibacter tadaridae TaxID=2483811 RepID=A0A3P5X425_9BACL|nr:ABC transporter ATP-binding protein [Filibacter tadaridae]VDC29040.1 Daunorubicin/doxorubicin resistance ATP-binding protein DrrA [Filibacter tadaridae]
MKKIIDVKRLSKSFGMVKAVNDISFYVEEGSLFSFLGTNGAGKSTTISILLTLQSQDIGEVKVNGYVVGKQDHAIRKEIGVVFQESVLDALLTVKENLNIRGSFYGLSKQERKAAIQRVVEITDCTSFLNRPYGKLSGGQKRRADIARALIHQPTILILDEPTTGLDPQSRKSIWEMILQLQRETRMTIFLTTHYIEEAANSDYVVVMKEGSIIAKGTPDQLKNTYSSHQLTVTTNNIEELRRELTSEGVNFKEEKSIFLIQLEHTTEAIPILSQFTSYITSFEVSKSSLDDVFITINGQDVAQHVNNR